MIINTEMIIEKVKVHSDFLVQFHQSTGKPILKFPRCKLSNRKFCRLINEKKYFVLPYVLFTDTPAVESLLKEIEWCSNNFKGNFGVKYTVRYSFPSDKIVIAFENEEDQVLFLLRSDFGTGNESW